MSSTDDGHHILSYVALGDSFTEGMDDPYPADPPGEGPGTAPVRFRGWADRLAEHLAAARSALPGAEVRYANLAVRGKLIGQIVADQLPRAVELRPDLVTLCAGGNDILRPGTDPDQVAEVFEGAVGRLRATGAHVVVFTGFDTGFQPVMRRMRGKIATYNMHIRAVADRYGCTVVDLWSMKMLHDPGAWSWDRLHLSQEGHRRLGLRVAEILGNDVEPGWDAPWPGEARKDWRAARQDDLHWAREFLVPWIGRRLTGRSSGDGRTAKRPDLGPVR